jgi:hypothetical protein
MARLSKTSFILSAMQNRQRNKSLATRRLNVAFLATVEPAELVRRRQSLAIDAVSRTATH